MTHKAPEAAREKIYITKSQQEERYRLLVESVRDYAIFMLDTEGYVATWNAGAKRLKGYGEEEILGKHFSIFYSPEDAASGKPERVLAAAVRDGRVEDEGWRVRKDGTRFWADVVMTALFDKKGTLQGFAKVTRDLTERKAMEDELEAANRELQRREEMLTALNETKDEFILLASHQLRTPATGVKQYLNLILQGFVGEVPEHIREMVAKANDSNERQIDLINDLLQVAQLDAGKIILNRKPHDIQKILVDVAAEQSTEIRKRNQELAVDVFEKPIVAYVDEQRLRMVFENLIDNASKYTPHGGKIRVATRTDKNLLKVSVKDTGVGIKSDDLKNLFTKFSRVPNELSNVVGGTGLGLYWASRIVELHAGTITVTSTPGEGSEFIVVIPVGA